MKGKYKIFLLEDDLGLQNVISEFLQDSGYEVDTAGNGEEAQEMLYENRYDVLLLDVNVPHFTGYELLKDAREDGVGTPTIFITSRSTLDDLEQGYESGCDDYLRKPFSIEELAVRIKTLIKRSFFHKNSDIIVIDANIHYDVINSQLVINSKNESLGAKESKLLKLLLQSPDETVGHELIYDTLWDYDEEPSDTSLRTYIKNLRKLIGKERIISIKKQGYKYVSNETH